MASKQIVKKQIGDFKAGIIFIFSHYSENKFKEDLAELRAYHDKKMMPDKKTSELNSEEKEELKKQLDFKFYSTEKFDKINYKVFKATLVDLFSKMFFYMIEQNKNLITSTEFNFQMLIKRIPGGEYYIGYGEEVKVSDAENACFEISGFWLIQNVVLPHVNGENSFSIIQRYLMHELTHHYDYVNKYDSFNRTYEQKIKRLYLKHSAYFLNCLYTSLFNLREEGLADFYARKNSSRSDMDMSGIREYNANLVKLSLLTRRKDSEEFYDKNISSGNLTPSSEYVAGRNMCVTIAMALSKKMNKQFNIIINGDKISSSNIKRFDDIFKRYDKTYISDIEPEVIDAAIAKIRPLSHYYFIQEYENACKELGIDEKEMIMTRRRFYNIIASSVERIRKEKTARLQSAGFEYNEEDVKQI